MHGIRSGLDAAARRMSPITRIPLRGPAGLFKTVEKHRKCWGILDACNANVSSCPIDVITFHRKGVNSSDDILSGTIELLEKFHNSYPNLCETPFANSEADPTSGWSKNVTSYADASYAHMLVSTVLQHWNAFLMGSLRRLESISHDNAFLSYHPFEFDQRTMLARFLMNESHPISVKFVQKPVYAALGMLSSLSTKATKCHVHKNVSYVASLDHRQYASILLLSTTQNYVDVQIAMNAKWNRTAVAYLAEFIDQEQTNPYAIWLKYNKPPYPNETVLSEMRRAQVNLK